MNLIENMRRAVQKEILTLEFRLLVGFVLASTIVFSIVQLGKAYQLLLTQFDNGFTLEVISFGSIAIAGSIALFFLFNGQSKKQSVEIVKYEHQRNDLSVPGLALGFVEGIFDGYHLKKRNKEVQ